MSEVIPGLQRRVALRVSFPCELAAVRSAVSSLRTFLEDQGFLSEEAAACELALAEASNNAIQHVPLERAHLPLVIEALCDETAAELRVEDRTDGFEWPASIELPDDESESGRGLFLITSLTDEAAYFRGREGNVLRLVKRRRHPVSAAGECTEARCRELESRHQENERVIRDMAEELSSCYESLAAIFRYSGEQAREGGLDDFARRLLEDLLRVTGNEWYVFRLLQSSPGELAVFACSEVGWVSTPLPVAGALAAAGWLEVQAVTERRDTWFESTSVLSPGDPLGRMGAGGAGFVHPVFLGDTPVGTLAVGGRAGGRRFTAAQMSVVQTFADFLAIQIVNSRFQEERVRNLLVAQELRIARQIQRSLLPDQLPDMGAVQLAGTCDSASEVGGDFFDVIPLAEGEVLVAIGDAMGKGLPAAMFALMLRGLIRALRDYASSPGGLLTRANALLHEELSRVDMFITAQLAYVNANERRLILANAGHCPALVVRAGTQAVEVHSPDGMPLGVLPQATFAEECVELADGVRCLLYTDGVTESTAADGSGLLGQRRLGEWLATLSPQPGGVEALKSGLMDLLAGFRNHQPPSDDQTFVVVGS